MDAKELYSQIEDIIGEALRPEIIRHYTVEEARVKCIALISSALSAQAAEVERLRGGIKLGMIYADIVRGGASKEETQSEAERDYARLAALLPPAAPEPTP